MTASQDTNFTEIEVKFYISDKSGTRKRLLESGAVTSGIVFESNIRYEDQYQSFIKNRSLLRLRKDKCARLTYKAEPEETDEEFKMYKELEVEIDDFNIMDAILQSIGFHQEQRYEKYRESFQLGNCTICMDTLPYGEFLEIEGCKEEIRQTAEQLKLPWNRRILTTYLHMFEVIKEKEKLMFNDITFKNFIKNQVEFSRYVNLFRVKV